ncbi:hypothetical protein [Sphingomonas jatrophae]|uniref:HNH endonuclease n=1 Tax=Sphingomonas jatrophae TaxID=1166337 RepID=A0A1I6JL39_9SPHN|nr:hypothetical protein [Sphingomonas jatrophae]SFR79634.1 hypothetical protein SAMN05192580_0426 [Sphingomonas jatrophae]
MPIRPELRERYPADWPEISRSIREDRAQGRCECTGQCGAHHRGYGAPAARCAAHHGQPHPVTTSPVVLTVAHLDRAPGNEDPANLLAMCQDCHLAYDLEDHVAQAMWTASQRRVEERRNLELFPLPIGPAEPRRAPEPTLPFYWHMLARLLDRHGETCRVVGRGKVQSVEVEFADGHRVTVSRFAIVPRQITQPAPPAPAPALLGEILAPQLDQPGGAAGGLPHAGGDQPVGSLADPVGERRVGQLGADQLHHERALHPHADGGAIMPVGQVEPRSRHAALLQSRGACGHV